jgi:ABC-type glycerol-3-phosphate transport system substrate-binding protein
VAKPPVVWDDFLVLAKKITQRDENKNILISAVPFGEFTNVENAKEIIATLIMQSGNPIVFRDEEGEIAVSLRDVYNDGTTPTESALRFYTEFSNPIKETYSWNKAMPNSQMAFLSGDLAIYFGFASELKELQTKNPNLNFDIAYLPQTENLRNNVTFGKMQALAISRGSKNVLGAFNVITNLVQEGSLTSLNQVTGLPPVSRVLLAQGSEDSYQTVLYKSALSAKGFLDPDKTETNLIFQDMVETVVSGRRKLNEAVSWANAELEELIKK